MNDTDSGERDNATMFLVDVQSHVIVVQHLGEPTVTVPVPDGVDIFQALDIDPPVNVTSTTTGWSVSINDNSSYYPQMLDFFRVSRKGCFLLTVRIFVSLWALALA